MSQPRRVLIVDGSEQSREVLRIALSRSGTQIFESDEVGEGLRLAQTCEPDVIVLDLEELPAEGDDSADLIGETARSQQTPILVLATARRQTAGVPSGEFVPKPYHYGPLIRRIEELLQQRSKPAA